MAGQLLQQCLTADEPSSPVRRRCRSYPVICIDDIIANTIHTTVITWAELGVIIGVYVQDS